MSSVFDTALNELAEVVRRIDPGQIDAACRQIAQARKLVLYGCGREALQLRGFAMRLYHLGRDVAMQGDMTTPPVGAGDLLVVSDGPGRLGTVAALVRVANETGAAVLLLTAEPEAAIARQADLVLTIPAQTMARDRTPGARSALPMGSVYEGTLFVLFEIMVLDLSQRLDVSPETMRARHTNLE